MDEQQRVVFLDFDGVLHPDNVFDSRQGLFLVGPGTLFMWMPLLEAALAPYPDVKIILSTSWIPSQGFDVAIARLSESLRNRVVGATFSPGMDSYAFYRLGRCQQILDSAASHRLDHWIAIDDDIWDWSEHIADRLVATKGKTGLSDPTVMTRLGVLLQKLCTG